MWRSVNKLQFQTLWGFIKSTQCKTSSNRRLLISKDLGEKYLPQVWFEKKSNEGKNENGYSRTKSGAFNYVRNDYLEAFGWSGIIFLSWYIWFPCCPRRIASNPAERYAYKCLPRCSTQEYASLVKCLSTLILDAPVNYVLPKVSATKSRQNSISETDESEALLKKGCENLESAHKKVRSSLSNWLGTECMQAGKYKEAFSHFSEAASSNHSAALFNLGLCYEMGLGTKQSFKRAAELYKRASDLGHATAMYNLGVFHVHGWGGVEPNSNEAHLLFVAAAELGQDDARRALNWQDDETCEEQCGSEDDTICNDFQPLFQEVVEPKDNDVTNLWLKVLNIKLDSEKTEPILVPKSEMLTSVDSGINDVSPTNDLEIFLRS